MDIRIESVHFTADRKLLDHIEKKIQKIQSRFDRIINTKVILKLENSGRIKDKIVEIILTVPRGTLVSKGVEKTFEQATNDAVQTLSRQIKRYKERLRHPHN